MISLNLIPNNQLKEYNKSFKIIIDKFVQNIDKKIKALFNILGKVVKKQDKKYIDIPISFQEINNLVKSSSDILKSIFIEINKTIFLVANTKFVTQNELDTQKKMEQQQQQLQEKINKSKMSFKSSNI